MHLGKEQAAGYVEDVESDVPAVAEPEIIVQERTGLASAPDPVLPVG